MTSPTDDYRLREFLERYPPRPYHQQGTSSYPETELEPVGPTDGLRLLNEVPAAAPAGTPRRSHEEDGENCHLWVIDERGRPCISEAPLPRLGSGKLHHTNLTGGRNASIGGEIWFGELPRIYLSGIRLAIPSASRMPNASSKRLASMCYH